MPELSPAALHFLTLIIIKYKSDSWVPMKDVSFVIGFLIEVVVSITKLTAAILMVYKNELQLNWKN